MQRNLRLFFHLQMSANREAFLLEQLDRLQKENVLLRQKIDLLIRRMFGSKSERLDANQLELLALLAQENAQVEIDLNSSGKAEASAESEADSKPHAPVSNPVRTGRRLCRLAKKSSFPNRSKPLPTIGAASAKKSASNSITNPHGFSDAASSGASMCIVAMPINRPFSRRCPNLSKNAAQSLRDCSRN